MKHFSPVSKTPPAVAVSSLQIKLDAVIAIMDRLLLAQIQSPWKTPFPPGGPTGTTGTDTTNTTDISGLI